MSDNTDTCFQVIIRVASLVFLALPSSLPSLPSLSSPPLPLLPPLPLFPLSPTLSLSSGGSTHRLGLSPVAHQASVWLHQVSTGMSPSRALL